MEEMNGCTLTVFALAPASKRLYTLASIDNRLPLHLPFYRDIDMVYMNSCEHDDTTI